MFRFKRSPNIARKVLVSLCLIGLFSIYFAAFNLENTDAYENRSSNDSRKGLACTICHYCQKPTKSEPCLYDCPRHLNDPDKDLKSNPEAGPDMVTINELEHLYQPTVFNHGKHARMASMSRGCSECHHYSPTGIYPACKECHLPGVPDENVKQPGLKGAYHRQCIGCHREWSNARKCEICHEPKAAGMETSQEPKLKKHFPVVTIPPALKYNTKKFSDSSVAFDHKNHSTNVGLRCQNCHKGNGCLPCHDQFKKERQQIQYTVDCLTCHSNVTCGSCHKNGTKTAFYKHNKDNYPLPVYHQKLTCQQCHGDPEMHRQPSVNCIDCHKISWLAGNFKHDFLGFQLDDDHEDLECKFCHINQNFTVKPNCSECHDNFYYPDRIPGTTLK